jgi:hypothetical protein
MTEKDMENETTDLNYFKALAEERLADARENMPDADQQSLILEISGSVVPGETKEISDLASRHIPELFLTSVETPVAEADLNAFHIIRVRMQEEIITHLNRLNTDENEY